MKKAVPILIIFILLSGNALAAERAPDFTITDVNSGETHRLSDFRGSFVLIDFMSVDCTGCEHLAKSMREIYPEYNDTVVFVSVDAGPSDNESQLRQKGFPWIAGLNYSAARSYSVIATPKVVIIDRNGTAVFQHNGEMSADDLRNALDDAISGKSEGINIEEVGIFTLALFAGIASFFSPCSFPMLPGYMAYYFGIGKEGEHRYRKAVIGGSAAAVGIISVYLLIGALLLFFGSAATPYIPEMGLVVGILMILLGILMFTPLEYNALVEPFRRISSKFGKKKEHGFTVKLFGYGVGYGSAAAGCTAPLFLAVVLGAMMMGLAAGITALLIYSLSAGGLMVFITVSMAALENRFVDALKRNTERIKVVSAMVLILVGAYLVWYHFA